MIEQEKIDVAIGIVVRHEKILICRRRAGEALGGFHEFPGGKCAPGEAIESCLSRELQEELGIVVTILQQLTPIDHHYEHASITLHPFLCELLHGEPRPLASDSIHWTLARDLHQYTFPPANEALLAEIVHRLVSK